MQGKDEKMGDIEKAFKFAIDSAFYHTVYCTYHTLKPLYIVYTAGF